MEILPNVWLKKVLPPLVDGTLFETCVRFLDIQTTKFWFEHTKMQNNKTTQPVHKICEMHAVVYINLFFLTSITQFFPFWLTPTICLVLTSSLTLLSAVPDASKDQPLSLNQRLHAFFFSGWRGKLLLDNCARSKSNQNGDPYGSHYKK